MDPSTPLYVIDPFGTTRDYDEALVAALKGIVTPVTLLTTRFNDRRNLPGVADNGFFLRGTSALHAHFSFIPLRWLKVIGAMEYFLDLVRIGRKAKREQATLHWQWLPFPLLSAPLLEVVDATRPNILTAHDVIPHRVGRRDKLSRGDRRKYRFASAIVLHGPTLASQLKDLQPMVAGKIHVIAHGLNYENRPEHRRNSARAELDLPSEVTLVGFMGLLRPHKGLADLITAWQLLQRKGLYAQHRLVIAGEWRAEEWRKQAYSEGQYVQSSIVSDPTIIFRSGYLSEESFLNAINAMDVIVLPYRYASQSGIALSALRYAIPLIVSRTGELQDILPEELQCWVVDPETPDQLAQKLEEYLRCPEEERRRLSLKLRTVAQAHSWSTIAKQYAELYASEGRCSTFERRDS